MENISYKIICILDNQRIYIRKNLENCCLIIWALSNFDSDLYSFIRFKNLCGKFRNGILKKSFENHVQKIDNFFKLSISMKQVQKSHHKWLR